LDARARRADGQEILAIVGALDRLVVDDGEHAERTAAAVEQRRAEIADGARRGEQRVVRKERRDVVRKALQAVAEHDLARRAGDRADEWRLRRSVTPDAQ